MSRDPYLDVKREVEQNLSAINGLLSNQGGSSNHGLVEELRGTLSLLEADLEDLDETVRVIEETGERWGIQESEVRSRRNFVQRVKSEAGDLKRKIANMGGGDRKGKGRARDQQGYRDVPLDLGAGQEDDAEEARRWEAEEQQTLMRRQDDTLGFISGTLTNLASQAGLIGQEVGEQSEMLDDLGNRVDNTDSRLRKVQKTMNDFIRRNEETKSGWCICILIVVLIILLVLVILT